MITGEAMKKKRKKKIKKIWEYIGIFVIIILIGIIITYTIKLFSSSKTKEKNIPYSNEAISIMKEKNIFDKIEEKEYSKTLETMILNHELKEEYIDAYYEIKASDKEEFPKLINLFLDKKYTPVEINNILEYLSDENINKLKEMNYTECNDFLKISNLNIEKIERYKAYMAANQTTPQDAVTKVNIGLDIDFYSQIETIKNPDSYTVLLNKYRGLPEDYVPSDLTPLSTYSSYKLRAKAAESYDQLESAALLDNVKIIPFSAYRTKNYQSGLYNRYVNRDGKKAADTYSARPRHSEHELGLAIDVRSSTLSDNLTEADYQWMQNNSYKYGFIIRYANGTTPITGYIEEPWHLRYVGVEIATDVHEKNITYDEYYDLYLKDKEN